MDFLSDGRTRPVRSIESLSCRGKRRRDVTALGYAKVRGFTEDIAVVLRRAWEQAFRAHYSEEQTHKEQRKLS